MHRPELQTGERFSIMAGAVLLEEDGSWALALDAPCNDGDERQEDDAHGKTHHDVEGALDELVEWLGQRLIMVGEHHCLAQLLGLKVEEKVARHSRNIEEMDNIFVAKFHKFYNLFMFIVRKAAKQLIDGCDIPFRVIAFDAILVILIVCR